MGKHGPIIFTSYEIPGIDGALFRVTETPERDQVVLSISRPDGVQTVRFDQARWKALMELERKVEVLEPMTEEERAVYSEWEQLDYGKKATYGYDWRTFLEDRRGHAKK